MENEKETISKDDLNNTVLQELKENPYHKFTIAFSLTTIIPFLAFFYVIVNISSLDALAGQNGAILFTCIVISICGFSIGYIIISNILRRLLFYAAKLKHSDQLKSTLIASVSHELKSPIAVIKTNLDLISEGLTGYVSEAQKKIVDLCIKVTGRMARLVTDLLDLHKIEAGMLDMRRERCDLSKLVESQVIEFGPLISQKGIKMVTELLDTDLMMWADGDKITRVINNLLSNAIKHTPDGQPVTVKAYPVEHFIRLEIADKGPGIPNDKLEKVFDKFERLDSPKEGTGLGLAITKDIVELHRGRVWAESLPGRGSTFVVVLPRDLRRAIRDQKISSSS